MRLKSIIKNLKLLYDKECQVCGLEHFKTQDSSYSEAHHLVPWSISHDDSRENLVVKCANCHRKFHHALTIEKHQMFNQLRSRNPGIAFNIPL